MYIVVYPLEDHLLDVLVFDLDDWFRDVDETLLKGEDEPLVWANGTS